MFDHHSVIMMMAPVVAVLMHHAAINCHECNATEKAQENFLKCHTIPFFKHEVSKQYCKRWTAELGEGVLEFALEEN